MDMGGNSVILICSINHFVGRYGSEDKATRVEINTLVKGLIWHSLAAKRPKIDVLTSSLSYCFRLLFESLIKSFKVLLDEANKLTNLIGTREYQIIW